MDEQFRLQVAQQAQQQAVLIMGSMAHDLAAARGEAAALRLQLGEFQRKFAELEIQMADMVPAPAHPGQ